MTEKITTTREVYDGSINTFLWGIGTLLAFAVDQYEQNAEPSTLTRLRRDYWKSETARAFLEHAFDEATAREMWEGADCKDIFERIHLVKDVHAQAKAILQPLGF